MTSTSFSSISATVRRTATSLPSTSTTSGAQGMQIPDELHGDTSGGVARQHEDPVRGVGQMIDDIGESTLIEVAERRLHVAQFQLQVGVNGVVRRWIADAFGGRA